MENIFRISYINEKKEVSRKKSYTNNTARRLICIHGWGYTLSKNDKKFIESASASFKVILLELYGYYEPADTNSKNASSKYQTIDELSLIASNTFAALRTTKNDIILAHSMGTLIMMPILKNYEEIKIILNGCPISVNKPFYTSFITKSTALINLLSKSKLAINYFNNMAMGEISTFGSKKKKSQYNGQADERTAFLNLIAIGAFDVSKYIPYIRQSNYVFLTYGDDDSNRLAAEKYGLKFTLIPDAGHNTMEQNPGKYISFIKSI